MVNKYSKILEIIKKEKGDVKLFMIVKFESSSKWNVVLSASWVNDENRDEVFKYLRRTLIDFLDEEEKNNITALVILDDKDSFVNNISKVIKLDSGETRFQENEINGLYINDAYIFRSV